MPPQRGGALVLGLVAAHKHATRAQTLRRCTACYAHAPVTFTPPHLAPVRPAQGAKKGAKKDAEE